MCFWGKPKETEPAPVVPAPAPAPAPSPVPTPSEDTAQKTIERKRRRIAAMKYGALSTVKTGGGGLIGKPELLEPTATASKIFIGS